MCQRSTSTQTITAMTSHNSENTDPIWRNVTLRMGLLLIAIIAAFYIGVKMGKTEDLRSASPPPQQPLRKKREPSLSKNSGWLMKCLRWPKSSIVRQRHTSRKPKKNMTVSLQENEPNDVPDAFIIADQSTPALPSPRSVRWCDLRDDPANG